jgi:hypothetical protein
MAVVMAPPAMSVMMVSNFDHNLRARCWNQRHEESEGENSKRKLFHTHGTLPLSSTNLRFRYQGLIQESNPTQVTLNWVRCDMAFNRPKAD